MSGIKEVRNDATDRFNRMFTRAQAIDGWLNRVAYPAYQKYQIERFENKNPRDGGWAPIKKDYEKWKLTRYNTYPGEGKYIGVSTAKMVGSIVGVSDEAPEFIGEVSKHRKMVSGGRMVISSGVDYTKYFDEKRTVSRFSKDFTDSLKRKLNSYLSEQGYSKT